MFHMDFSLGSLLPEDLGAYKPGEGDVSMTSVVAGDIVDLESMESSGISC
jgi:hypothetical protein